MTNASIKRDGAFDTSYTTQVFANNGGAKPTVRELMRSQAPPASIVQSRKNTRNIRQLTREQAELTQAIESLQGNDTKQLIQIDKIQTELNNIEVQVSTQELSLQAPSSSLSLGEPQSVSLRASAETTSYNLTFPASNGSEGQVLSTSKEGQLKWTSPNSEITSCTPGTVSSTKETLTVGIPTGQPVFSQGVAVNGKLYAAPWSVINIETDKYEGMMLIRGDKIKICNITIGGEYDPDKPAFASAAALSTFSPSGISDPSCRVGIPGSQTSVRLIINVEKIPVTLPPVLDLDKLTDADKAWFGFDVADDEMIDLYHGSSWSVAALFIEADEQWVSFTFPYWCEIVSPKAALRIHTLKPLDDGGVEWKEEFVSFGDEIPNFSDYQVIAVTKLSLPTISEASPEVPPTKDTMIMVTIQNEGLVKLLFLDFLDVFADGPIVAAGVVTLEPPTPLLQSPKIGGVANVSLISQQWLVLDGPSLIANERYMLELLPCDLGDEGMSCTLDLTITFARAEVDFPYRVKIKGTVVSLPGSDMICKYNSIANHFASGRNAFCTGESDPVDTNKVVLLQPLGTATSVEMFPVTSSVEDLQASLAVAIDADYFLFKGAATTVSPSPFLGELFQRFSSSPLESNSQVVSIKLAPGICLLSQDVEMVRFREGPAVLTYDPSTRRIGYKFV